MKKGCLIVLIILAVLLALVVVAGVVGYKVLDSKFGLKVAPAISHETLCSNDTRIRLLVRPEPILPILVQYLPPDIQVPLELKPEDVAAQLAPREIAVLGKTNMATRKMQFTLFANEKRGGPAIEAGVREGQVLDQIQQIAWTTNGLELRERGLLLAEGDLAIPEAVESELLQLWPTPSTKPAEPVQGTHHAELVVDNRNGDILALAAAAVAAGGQDWETVRTEQAASMAIGIIQAIYVARVTANLTDTDNAAFTLHISAEPKSGPGLQFLLSGVAMPWLKDKLKNDFNLILEGDTKWDEAQQAVVGEYKLSGILAVVKKQLGQ